MLGFDEVGRLNWIEPVTFVALFVIACFFARKWHKAELVLEFHRISLTSASAELLQARTELRSLTDRLATSEQTVREYSNLNRCYSADGLTCGWHNISLQAGSCTISNKRVWQADRKIYRPQGRVTGSQHVRRLEAQAAAEE